MALCSQCGMEAGTGTVCASCGVPRVPPPPTGAPAVSASARSAGEVSVHDLEVLSKALGVLVPVKSWLKNPTWHQGLRLLVIPYALLPLSFIALFAGSGNLTTPGWAYSLYVAPLWLIAFWYLIRPGRIERMHVAIGGAVVVWVLVWMKLVTAPLNGHLGQPNQPLSFFDALGVGINEEVTKALPVLVVALLLLKFRQTKLDVRMWMFMGTVAGLTFGVYEASLYTVGAILQINAAHVNNQAVVSALQFSDRVFVDGFQHAVWAGISCFFVGMAVNYRRRRVEFVALGVLIAAVLHCLNDWIAPAFGSLWAQVVVDAVSLFLFFGYTMSARDIERAVQQDPLFDVGSSPSPAGVPGRVPEAAPAMPGAPGVPAVTLPPPPPPSPPTRRTTRRS